MTRVALIAPSSTHAGAREIAARIAQVITLLLVVAALPSCSSGKPGPAGGTGPTAGSPQLYWANHDDGAVGRANLDGTNVDNKFITGAKQTCGVAVDATHVYWGDEEVGGVGRANLDGTGVTPDFITSSAPRSTCGVAVDDAHLYWANFDDSSLGRANLDGTRVDSRFITGAVAPCGVAVDRQHVYWANSLDNKLGPGQSRR